MKIEVLCCFNVVVVVVKGLSREVVLFSITALIHFIMYSIKFIGLLMTLSRSRYILNTYYMQGIVFDFGGQGMAGGQRASLFQVSCFRTSDFLSCKG